MAREETRSTSSEDEGSMVRAPQVFASIASIAVALVLLAMFFVFRGRSPMDALGPDRRLIGIGLAALVLAVDAWRGQPRLWFALSSIALFVLSLNHSWAIAILVSLVVASNAWSLRLELGVSSARTRATRNGSSSVRALVSQMLAPLASLVLLFGGWNEDRSQRNVAVVSSPVQGASKESLRARVEEERARKNLYRARAAALQWTMSEEVPSEGYVALATIDWELGLHEKARKVLTKVATQAASTAEREEAAQVLARWGHEP